MNTINMQNKCLVHLVSLILIVLGFISCGTDPVPQNQSIAPKQNPEATAPAHKDANSNKVARPSLFNSFLCGAGYNYDQKTLRCIFSQRSKNENPTNATTNTGRDDNVLDASENVAQNESSVEPTDYSKESLAALGLDGDRFIPLECGMNYRYLRRDKICKPLHSPKSAESDENAKQRSSSEEEDVKGQN